MSLPSPELENLAARLKRVLGESPDRASELDLGVAAADLLADACKEASQGAREADRVVRFVERFLPGVGWSYSTGALHGSLVQDLERLADLLSRLDELQELADALGRLEEEEHGRLEQSGGGEEVVGVRLGAEVSRALPSELGLLGDAETEDLFYQRMLERRLVSLELTGAGEDGVGEPTSRGPVIACIDTSGSMRGAPEAAAKALVLAVCRRVLPQGRVVHLLLFGGPDEFVELRLQTGRGGLEALLEFLTLSFSGGTDFDVPLERSMELLEERELERADVLLVTDGMGMARPEVVRRVIRVRQERGVQVWSVVLNPSRAFAVEGFSDEVWSLDPRAEARALGLVGRFGDTAL